MWDTNDFTIDRGIQERSYKNHILKFQERRMQIVMIRVAQHQHGGIFLRFAWNPWILVLESTSTDIEARSSSLFNEFGSIIE